MKPYLSFLVLALTLVSSVVAAREVIIFEFSYDKGLITLENQILTPGYAPDYRIQPGNDSYRCSLATEDGTLAYSLNFDLPIHLFTDGPDESQDTMGHSIFLNQTEFSLIMPYLNQSSYLVCTNPKGYNILKESLTQPDLSPETQRGLSIFWVYLVVSTIGLIIILRKAYSRK